MDMKHFCFIQDPKSIVSFVFDTQILLEIGGSGKQLRKKQLYIFLFLQESLFNIWLYMLRSQA